VIELAFFRQRFEKNLLKAELEVGEEKAVLRLEVDTAVREKKIEKYHNEGLRSKHYSSYSPNGESAEIEVKNDVENGKQKAIEWARTKTNHKLDVIFHQDKD
jgi:sirohydrochlorin ferrochelatase